MFRGYSPSAMYGLGNAVKSGINWSSLLGNTQKTLGIINQAIPAFYQVRPIFNNMKTMFKVANEINKDDKPKNNNNYYNNNTNTNINNINNTTRNNTNNDYYSNGGPQFFV